MKMYLHAHELRHTQGPIFFLCALFLSSLRVCGYCYADPCIFGLGQIPRLEWSTAYPRSCKGSQCQGSDKRVKENSCNWWRFRKPVMIPSTDVSCQPVHWVSFIKCSLVVVGCFVVLVCFSQVVSLSAFVSEVIFAILDFTVGNNECRKIFIFL